MLGAALPAAAAAQSIPPELMTSQGDDRRPKRLPNGRLISEAIIKEDNRRNLDELKKIREITAALEKDLEETEGHVLSIDNLKRLEEIEKLSRSIRGRMRRPQ